MISEKNTLLGIAAHDLRNPLGAIRGFTDFVVMSHKKELPSEALELLGIVKDTSNYMLGMVEDMLDFAAVSDGELRLERAPVDVVRMVTEAVRVNQMLADRKKITLALDLAPGCSEALSEFVLDKRKLRQVLDNLLGNAVKFSTEGAEVQVGLAEEDGGLWLTLASYGATWARCQQGCQALRRPPSRKAKSTPDLWSAISAVLL